MTVYQLDECIDSKRFAADCHASANVLVRRYPPALRGRGVSDAEMLAALLPNQAPLLTTDLRLLSEWTAHIPARHAGIIVVPPPVKSVRTLLTRLKRAIPSWPNTSLGNSILTIREDAVEVHRVATGAAILSGRIEYHEPAWATKLLAMLSRNDQLGSNPAPTE